MAHLSVYFSLENAGGSHQRARLKQGLDTLPGVTSVSINDRGCLAVDYDSTGLSARRRSAEKFWSWAFPFSRRNKRTA